MAMTYGRVPWIFWPVVALWRLLSTLVRWTGRLVGIVFGFTLMALGLLLTLTIAGAIVGIPVGVVGLLITIKSLF
jgi:hypothetical protein